KARTPNQQRLVEAVRSHDMVFAIGPAGTGKTYTAVALAVKALKERQVRRIILT
ncbi:MAG: PhoH family protein, partial [Flavobacteriales bacterium]|nr:PhoH family protein [Flavobacteriales bacterium]